MMFLGSLASAYEHLTQGTSLYDPHRHHAQVAVYGLDPGVFCRSYAAFTRMCLGYPDQARQGSEEALILARSLEHPYTTAFALTWAAVVHHVRREVDAAQEHAEALIALAQSQEFPYWLGFGLLIRGWALAMQGKRAEGCEQIRHGLTALQSMGTIVGTRFGVSLLAEADSMEGQVEEGLVRVTEVLPTVDHRGERLWDAELYRLKGDLTLRSKTSDRQVKGKFKTSPAKSAIQSLQSGAEECFQKAIDIARQQSAKSWELRAAMSLGRLWRQQGKKAEARQLLAEIYSWFTEGFDTKDLQEAKTLLHEWA